MKKYIFILFFFAYINGFGQIKIYSSNYQISESDASIGKAPYKIIIDEAKLSTLNNGYVKLIDLEQNSKLLTLKSKYLKTTNDEEGVIYWFRIYGNTKFNVLKECLWSKPQNIKGQIYKSIIIFSNYDDNGTRLNDLGFLSNLLNDNRTSNKNLSNDNPISMVSTNNNTFQVIAQKAYFYNLTEHGGSRRKGYLVEGEKIKALNGKDGYVYCEFTNATTKKTSKGWILKDCLDVTSSNVGIARLDNSPYSALLKFDGEYTQKVNFFKQQVVVTELRKIMGNEYPSFVNDFLASSAGVQIAVRNKVLLVDTFIPHGGPNNRAVYFIDVVTHQSFLYWKDGNGKDTFFGKTPVSNNMSHCMQQQLKTNLQYENNPDRSIMIGILEKATAQ